MVMSSLTSDRNWWLASHSPRIILVTMGLKGDTDLWGRVCENSKDCPSKVTDGLLGEVLLLQGNAPKVLVSRYTWGARNGCARTCASWPLFWGSTSNINATKSIKKGIRFRWNIWHAIFFSTCCANDYFKVQLSSSTNGLFLLPTFCVRSSYLHFYTKLKIEKKKKKKNAF